MSDFKITGDKEIEKSLNMFENKDMYLGAMQKVAAYMESEAKKNITRNGSVVTGQMRREVSSYVTEDGDYIVGVCYSPTEYSPYVEYGTVRAQAKPFMRPVLNNEEEIRDIFAQNIKQDNKEGEQNV